MEGQVGLDLSGGRVIVTGGTRGTAWDEARIVPGAAFKTDGGTTAGTPLRQNCRVSLQRAVIAPEGREPAISASDIHSWTPAFVGVTA